MDKARSRLYSTWHAMMDRCYSEKHPKYRLYGARGLTVCERWHKFQNFVDDMSPKPAGMMLERVDNDAGYSPENCKWATIGEQIRNRRMTIWLEFRGDRLCLKDMGEKYGKTKAVMRDRLKSGWTLEEALLIPVSAKNIELSKRGLRHTAVPRSTDGRV